MNIKQYLIHCKVERKLSLNTIKAYQLDLKQFKNYLLSQHNIKRASLTQKKHIREYISSLSNYSTRTIKRKVASINAYYNFLEYEESIDENPFRKIRVKIRTEKQLPVTLSLQEIEIILKNLYTTKKQIKKNNYNYRANTRDIAVIELLFATGIRVSELCSLRLENIGSNFTHLKIMGKGKKERIVPITNKSTKTSLSNYYKVFKPIIDDREYFFINRLNQQLSEQSVRFLVKRIAIESGIKRKITPHVFRHTFATLLLEANVDIRYIQELLGHSSIIVTQIYTHVSNKKTHEILSLKHPRNQILNW